MAIAAYNRYVVETGGSCRPGYIGKLFLTKALFLKGKSGPRIPLPSPQHTWNLTLPSSQSRTPLRIAHCGCFAYSGPAPAFLTRKL
jgi:hypothetical protein